MKTFKELDTVLVRGTIVHVYGDGKAYEIEIVGSEGDTRAIFTVYDDTFLEKDNSTSES